MLRYCEQVTWTPGLSFCTCKMGMIIVSTSEDGCESRWVKTYGAFGMLPYTIYSSSLLAIFTCLFQQIDLTVVSCSRKKKIGVGVAWNFVKFIQWFEDYCRLNNMNSSSRKICCLSFLNFLFCLSIKFCCFHYMSRVCLLFLGLNFIC